MEPRGELLDRHAAERLSYLVSFTKLPIIGMFSIKGTHITGHMGRDVYLDIVQYIT